MAAKTDQPTKPAPVPELVVLERELAEATHLLANATETFLEARQQHGEATARWQNILERVGSARGEAGA